jgi:ankyrin repeat protein
MGADPNISLEDTRRNSFYPSTASALSLAVESKSHNTVKTLLAYGISNDLCHAGLDLAMKLGDEPLVTSIMQWGIQGKWLIEPYGVTVLFCAARTGHATVVKSLLEKGLDVNIWSEGHIPNVERDYMAFYCGEDNTSLRLAIRGGHPAVIDVLFQHGAEIDFKGDGPIILLNVVRRG